MTPFGVINTGLEAISATLFIMTRISERQQQRLAEGKSLTEQDLQALMNEGDVKAAAEKIKLAAAKLAFEQS